MYDILVYVFENCQQYELSNEKERVAKKLSAAGFDDSDISEALTWLAGVPDDDTGMKLDVTPASTMPAATIAFRMVGSPPRNAVERVSGVYHEITLTPLVSATSA